MQAHPKTLGGPLIAGYAYRYAPIRTNDPVDLTWDDLQREHARGLANLPVLLNHNKAHEIGRVTSTTLDNTTRSMRVSMRLFNDHGTHEIAEQVRRGAGRDPPPEHAMSGLSIGHNLDTRMINEISICRQGARTGTLIDVVASGEDGKGPVTIERPNTEHPCLITDVINIDPVVEAPPTPAPVVQTPQVPAPVVQAPPAPTPVVEAPPVPAPVVQAPPAPTPVVEAPPVPTPAVQAPPAPTPAVQTPPTPASVPTHKTKKTMQAANTPPAHAQADDGGASQMDEVDQQSATAPPKTREPAEPVARQRTQAPKPAGNVSGSRRAREASVEHGDADAVIQDIRAAMGSVGSVLGRGDVPHDAVQAMGANLARVEAATAAMHARYVDAARLVGALMIKNAPGGPDGEYAQFVSEVLERNPAEIFGQVKPFMAIASAAPAPAPAGPLQQAFAAFGQSSGPYRAGAGANEWMQRYMSGAPPHVRESFGAPMGHQFGGPVVRGSDVLASADAPRGDTGGATSTAASLLAAFRAAAATNPIKPVNRFEDAQSSVTAGPQRGVGGYLRNGMY